ncbi:MAG TPA: sugar phosphate isomerase/epimerase [Candidatus Hydrogenedentes bacterium]|nr:sugar phosphate isomerase/epimerase [Candidatus Hydrogenedentota bacterium]
MKISRRLFLMATLAGTPGIAMAPILAKPEKKGLGALNLAFMCWRIGDILDFDAQVQWVKQAGFESIAFHASAGDPGKWRGIDPAHADAQERRRLCDLLATFRRREIHAPFSAELAPETPPVVLEQLEATFAFAGDVGANAVTVHAKPPPLDAPDTTSWHKTLDRLDRAAATAGIRMGIEFMKGFEWLRAPRHEHIGATLDVGHMYLNNGAGYQPYGGIREQIRVLGDVLFHIHIHDYDGEYDHREIGKGRVDIDAVLLGLADIGYRGVLCLELNPDRVTPEGIVRSAAFLRNRARELDLLD